MKKFKFDHQAKAWDRYQSFHSTNGGMVEFDTGEVMVKSYIHVYDRRMYDDYGIQLVATTDKECPQLYLDKECTEPVKKAWITHHGMQELAIDHEQNVAVALTGRQHAAKPIYLGKHVHHATAYWAGAKRLPVALGMIKVQTPNPEYKKQVQSRLINEVVPAIVAIHKMRQKKSSWTEGKYLAKETWLDSSSHEIVADICSESEEWQLGRDLKQIYENGFEYPRLTTKVDYLYTKSILAENTKSKGVM